MIKTKRRKFISTPEALELQKRINSTKHERARKLLESHITRTYVESWVDLDNNKAILLCAKDRVSGIVKGQIEDMAQSIMNTYSQIERVDLYGYSETMKAIESGELKFPLKSSVIHPETVGESNNIPSMVVNDTNEMQYDKDTKEDVEKLFDLRDNAFQKMGLEPTLTPDGDQETGEIRVIIEVANPGR